MSLALRRARSDTLGGDRMIADELPVSHQHAAEVLRPWLVRGRVEDHATDLAGAQLLRLGGKREKRIDFPLDEQLHGEQPHRVAGRTLDPFDVLVRVEPDIRRHDRHVAVFARAQDIDADLLALQVADGADGLVREQLEASGMHARQRRDRHAGIQAEDDRFRASESAKSSSPRAIICACMGPDCAGT